MVTAVLPSLTDTEAVAPAPSLVMTGASFTATTLMLTVSTSVAAPPVPALPRSLVVTVSVSAPLYWAVGV